MAFDNLLSELWISEKEPFFNLAVLSNSTTDTLFDFGTSQKYNSKFPYIFILDSIYWLYRLLSSGLYSFAQNFT